MKRILMEVEVSEKEYDFIIDELNMEMDNSTNKEKDIKLTSFETYEEDEIIPDIMKRDDRIFKVSSSLDSVMKYGTLKFDIETKENEGFRRIQIFDIYNEKYVVHKFNGNIIEFYKL